MMKVSSIKPSLKIFLEAKVFSHHKAEEEADKAMRRAAPSKRVAHREAVAAASTEVKSETRQSNPDGSVTTTITYIDGSVEKTTSQPDLEKASDNYKLQHPEKDKKNNDKETESGSLVSIKV